MNRSRFTPLRTIAIILLITIPAVATTLSFKPAPESMEAGVPRLLDRMTELTPSNPMGYFELAEELAYLSAVSPNQRRTALDMAKQLYVLAYELDRRNNPRPALGASVCYGLADIAPTTERDWLLALAASFGAEGSERVVLGGGLRVSEDRARIDVAEALGHYRAVERRPLSAILRRVNARQQMINAGVSVQNADWAVALLQAGLDKPYCPECRNLRLVRIGNSDQTVEQQLCPTCFGNPEPDPELSPDGLQRMLAIEAKLLGAIPGTWSAQVGVEGSRPVPDLDPSALADQFGVDPERPYWIPESDTALIGAWSDQPASRSVPASD